MDDNCYLNLGIGISLLAVIIGGALIIIGPLFIDGLIPGATLMSIGFGGLSVCLTARSYSKPKINNPYECIKITVNVNFNGLNIGDEDLESNVLDSSSEEGHTLDGGNT